MEKRRSALLSVPPFGRGFSRQGVFRSDGGWAAQERVLTLPFIVSISPPGYPSAWLRPCSARLPFSRQDHCSSTTSIRLNFPFARQPGGVPEGVDNQLRTRAGQIVKRHLLGRLRAGISAV